MSEFEQDYIMRQIKNISGALAKFLFHKDTPAYVIRSLQFETDGDLLYAELNRLLDDGFVNEAENLLFEHLDRDNSDILEVALDFYSRVDGIEDEQLRAASYSRREIRDGLASVLKFYRVPMDQIVAYFQELPE